MTVLYEKGDRVEGERIVCTCRQISKTRLIRRTDSHRGLQIILKGGASCRIEKPLMIK